MVDISRVPIYDANMTSDPSKYSSAIEDFNRARRKSGLERIMARLAGKSSELLSYDDVRKRLQIHERKPTKLQEIPLDAIVGSVDRYTDFTRSFLPKQESDADRWAGVKVAVTGMKGLPPIQVYQIGGAYFVEDGNHRVSVARDLGQSHIQAYVTELKSRVPLSPDDDVDDLILKAEYVDFLEHTRLDQTRPDADLRLSAPGGYRTLEEHIAVHRYFMGIEQNREIPYVEAAAHWHDEVYLPVVTIIRELGILRDFPGRTEADLYLWISEHRTALQEMLETEVDPREAASDLAAQQSRTWERVVARLGDRIVDALIPEPLEPGPPPGVIRKEDYENGEHLFKLILVPVSGDEAGFKGLEQAIVVAQRESARLYGLHIVPTEEQKESEDAQSIRAEFERRCIESGVSGHLALVVGDVSRVICDRARWADLITLNVSFPPPPQPFARLSSGLSTVIRRCPRPVLTVPGKTTSLGSALLAYDGSPKSDEALFVACHLADQWKIPLVVVSVDERGNSAEHSLEQAQEYLANRAVQAELISAEGAVAEAILKIADEYASELIIMGGYGRRWVPEVVLGSVVDEVLRTTSLPLLICR